MTKNNYIFILITASLFFLSNVAKSQNEVKVIGSNSEFLIHQDTIAINVIGEMTHALKFENKYYVLFEQPVLKYGGYGKQWLYIFSNGQVEKMIDCPKEMKTTYLDFYVKNDSIILKPYMDKQSYSFDVNNYTWLKINETDDLIFEDDKYYVYSLDFGEWGGKTWFKDKETGVEYVTEVTTPLVNKIGTTYYLSNSFQVLKVDNPHQLTQCENDVTYEKIQNSGKYHSWYSEPKGYETIYKNDEIDYFDFKYHPYLVSSFVYNNELLHIYETDSATYLSRIVNTKIEPFKKIVDSVKFYNWHESYRCKNLNGHNELLKFKTQKENIYGLINVAENKVLTTYLVNNAELKPQIIGRIKSNNLLKNRLKTILNDFENLSLTEIESKEQAWGTFDITPNHNIGIGESMNPNNYIINANKSYLIVEDSIISNSIMYYATKKPDLIRTVTIKWEKNNSSGLDLKNKARDLFTKRYSDLKAILIQELGEPTKSTSKEKNTYTSAIWKTSNNIKIELEVILKSNYNNIEIIIYKSKTE